jgi:hypothetical protein
VQVGSTNNGYGKLKPMLDGSYLSKEVVILVLNNKLESA